MGSQDAASSPDLSDFLSGKRTHPRFPVSLRVELAGADDRLPGRAIGASGSGVLVAVDLRELNRLRRPSENVAEALELAFGRGMDVHFAEAGVVADAVIVRLEFPEPGADCFLLGCRFRTPLSLAQQVRLGIEAGCDRDGPAIVDVPLVVPAPYDALPYEPRDAGVSMSLFEGPRAASSPRFHAQVRRLGGHAMTAWIEDTGLGEVACALGASKVSLRLAAGGDTWSSPATLVAARYVDTLTGAVEVVLIADDAPSRRIRKAFRRRA